MKTETVQLIGNHSGDSYYYNNNGYQSEIQARTIYELEQKMIDFLESLTGLEPGQKYAEVRACFYGQNLIVSSMIQPDGSWNLDEVELREIVED